MVMPNEPQFSISPSLVGRYFFFNCDRFLRYSATPRAARSAEGIPAPTQTGPRTQKAVLEWGRQWESKVLRRLRGKVAISKSRAKRLTDRTFGVDETIRTLQTIAPGKYIYQPTLSVPKSFLEANNLADGNIRFEPCRPDLLYVDVGTNDRPSLRVIDLKASDLLRVSHKIQVYLYALILKQLVQSEGISTEVDLEKGAVWLHEKDSPEEFEFAHLRDFVHSFLQEDLRKILETPIDHLHWHLYYRCEWCEYFEHCKDEALAKKTISLIPYLSVHASKFLKQGAWDCSSSVKTLRELKRLLRRKDADDILDACGSLRAKRSKLERIVHAITANEMVEHDTRSVSMPRGEDIQIIFSFQSEPVTGQIYVAGFRRFKGREVFGTSAAEQIFIAESPEAVPDMHHRFLSALKDELEKIEAYNEDKEWRSQKSVQSYVFDRFEQDLFFELLLNGLTRKETSRTALQLLFYYQHASLSEAEDHPSQHVLHPIVVLRQAINEMLALPVQFVLRLQDVSRLLQPENFKFLYTGDDMFTFPLSNRIKSDAIMLAWNHDRIEPLEWIKKEISRRLKATSAIVDGFRQRVATRLFAWPPKFRFPDPLNYDHPLLSQLAFFVSFECVTGFLETRRARARPFEEREREEISIRLRYCGNSRWKVISEIAGGRLEVGDYPSYLLVPDGREGEEAQMGFNDFANRRFWANPRAPICFAAIRDLIYNYDGFVSHMILKLKQPKGSKEFPKGSKAVLHPRFTDETSYRLLGCLKDMDSQPECEFLRLMTDPQSYAHLVSTSKKLSVALSRLMKKAPFTPSQAKAFKNLVERQLTLVWGPPGTGKTHALAHSIAIIAIAHLKIRKPLWIAVTAFTHAAVENLLVMLVEALSEYGYCNDIPVFKVGGTRRGLGVYDGSIHPTMILGGTVYGLSKLARQGLKFDMLVVDEASQMKLPELALGMTAKKTSARLVLAGDDLQLPPIVKAEYPEPQDGGPVIHESAFGYLRSKDSTKVPYTTQLLENWRMNDTLTAFPARMLYGRNFRPATKEVAERRTRLKNGWHTNRRLSRTLRWICDPDFPLVLCIWEDIRAGADNRLEAEIVAQIARFFRLNLLADGSNRTYPKTRRGDKAFWEKGLFIVSPHHVQIRLIKHHLRKCYDWKSPPFVDTVEKMQGQQCEVVVVSYGISDVERAMAESRFIYGQNRLNVAMTRARSKCIAFLSRQLLTAHPDLIEIPKAAEGLAYMKAFANFVRTEGQLERFYVTSDSIKATLTVYRVGHGSAAGRSSRAAG